MEEQYADYRVPIDFYHLFVGRPQCAIVKDGYVEDLHLHKEMELALVTEGQVNIMADKQVFTVLEGELFCIKENVLHQYLPNKQNTTIIKIKFMREWLVPVFFHDEEKDKLNHMYGQVFLANADERIRDIVQSMLSYQMSDYKDFFYLGKTIELTAWLMDNPQLIKQIMDVEADNHNYMERALAFMQERCYGKLTLKMLADHLGLTESYCSKYIKRNTGITFVDYLNAVRISNAQRLLVNTDFSIMEVAQRTGFFSIQTFNRVFKKMTGKSPREYKTYKIRK
jgi:YesN/AraC family two-component response regulator